MKAFAMLVAILASAPFVAETVAQTQAPPPARERAPSPGAAPEAVEGRVEGRVMSVDPSRTEITLSDGTKLTTPAGSVLKPGAITEGMLIAASYREENGAKVLTGLAIKDRGPATR
jgi:hypothetical protein